MFYASLKMPEPSGHTSKTGVHFWRKMLIFAGRTIFVLMGIQRYPVGIQSFEEIRSGGYVYVDISIKRFKGDGDFRSLECVELLNYADVVVTNPPFSLFREHLSQIIKHDKQFLIIGNINAITYKEVFHLIQSNRIWLGVHLGRGISGFKVPEHYELYGTETSISPEGERIISPNNCLWLTNLDVKTRHNLLPLTKMYRGNEAFYPKFDNYNGINVNKTQDIPMDYDGAIGVPITFLHKYNPSQFEIIQFRKGDDGKDLSINGKCPYFRILIKHKHPVKAHSYIPSALTQCPKKSAGYGISSSSI